MKKSTLTLLFFLLTTASLWSQNYDTSTTNLNLSKNKVAIDGYDLITYFTQEEPSEGSKEWQSNFNGARYYFINEATKLKFNANPNKFLPEFGGW